MSPETHEFIRVCLGLTLVQGYSLTETTCSGTCMEWGDMTVGKVKNTVKKDFEFDVKITICSWLSNHNPKTDE